MIGGGVPASWVDKPMRVGGLPTSLGLVDWSWKDGKMQVTVHGAKPEMLALERRLRTQGDEFIMTRILCLLLIIALPAQAAEPKIPIIHSTDLCHPYDDPDDHYDLACLFALREFDIRGIVLDLGEHQASRPGRPAVEQMLHITGRKVPYAVGLNKPLRSREDKALDGAEQFQGGIRLILSLLRDSQEKVVIHTAGSCRDVAAAFNREPELFRKKVKAIYIEAGNGPGGDQKRIQRGALPAVLFAALGVGPARLLVPLLWQGRLPDVLQGGPGPGRRRLRAAGAELLRLLPQQIEGGSARLSRGRPETASCRPAKHVVYGADVACGRPEGLPARDR